MDERRDDLVGEALVGLVRGAVAIGLERQQPEPMLRWLIDEGPAAFPDAFAPVEPPTPGGHRAFAAHLGVGIWNALPLPRRGFRSEPLPRPERNRPCPCGSGKKLKRCCGPFGFQAGMIPDDAVLPLVAELLPESELPDFGASSALGPQRLAELGHHLLETPRRAARLLEGTFAEPERLDGRYAAAVDALLEAYQRLGWAKKEHELGERLIARARPELQASVWLRRAVSAGDLGVFGAAHEYLDRARACDPTDERLGPMEVKILEVEGRYEEAAARAPASSSPATAGGPSPTRTRKPWPTCGGRRRVTSTRAHRHLPRIGAALTSRAAERPSSEPDGFFGGYVSGGEAEAEAYAERMGDLWASVPGLLDWLRATRRGLPKRRRR